MKMTGRMLLLGTICVAAAGCSENRSAMNRSDQAADGTITVTARKPVITSDSASTATIEADRESGTASLARTNTGVNERDRDDSSKTPLDQNENKTDIRITSDIRSRVVATEMSIDAHNVKIITEDGRVTLRGPVRTADEKRQIEEIAGAVAGHDRIDSQLEVVAN